MRVGGRKDRGRTVATVDLCVVLLLTVVQCYEAAELITRCAMIDYVHQSVGGLRRWWSTSSRSATPST